MTQTAFTRIANREIRARRVGSVEAALVLAMIVFLVSAFVWAI